MGNINTI